MSERDANQFPEDLAEALAATYPKRDANQLAAAVREPLEYPAKATARTLDDPDWPRYLSKQEREGLAALDELVALVGTLQQERDDQYAIRAQLEVESNANATAARDAQEALARSYVERREYADLTKAISARAEAAEAQVEALQQERDEAEDWRNLWKQTSYKEIALREAAEAALAEAREMVANLCTRPGTCLADTGGDTKESPLAIMQQALKTVADGLHVPPDGITDDGITAHRYIPGHPMGCPICIALDAAGVTDGTD